MNAIWDAIVKLIDVLALVFGALLLLFVAAVCWAVFAPMLGL